MTSEKGKFIAVTYHKEFIKSMGSNKVLLQDWFGRSEGDEL